MSDITVKKGKCFSFVNQGQRNKGDLYQTPYSLTRLFMQSEKPLFLLSDTILEPAAGHGAIAKVLQENENAFGCYRVTAYDLETNGKDFFRETGEFDTVMTNPPYIHAGAFIRKAKEISRKFIVMLLPLSYLQGKERLDTIWTEKEFPLARIHVFCRFPLLTDGLRTDGKHETGMQAYAWYVWEKDYKGNPEILWLDNDPFVVRNGDRSDVEKKARQRVKNKEE